MFGTSHSASGEKLDAAMRGCGRHLPAISGAIWSNASRIGRPIRETAAKGRLLLRLHGEGDEFPRQPGARRALRHEPHAHVAPGAVPHDFQRRAAVDQLAGARVPHPHHVDFAVAEELLRLVALRPPHLDVRLDLVELAEGAVDVERKTLSGGTPSASSAKASGAHRVVVQRTVPGNFFTSQKSAQSSARPAGTCPCDRRGTVPSAQLAMPLDDDGVREQLLLLHDRPVDRLHQAFALGEEQSACVDALMSHS